MKKIIVVLIAALAITTIASAQPRALGLRGTYGADVSYQHNFGSNFAEFNLGLFKDAFHLTAVYDYIIANPEPFNVYAGFGLSLAASNKIFNPGIVGQIGLEYQIQAIPLNISLDWTPGYYFGQQSEILGFRWEGIALGVRYRF